MADKPTQLLDLVGRRRDWTPIAALLDESGPEAEKLLALAQEHRWRWVALSNTSGTLPPDVALRGALVNKVPTDTKVRALLNEGIPTVRIGAWPHPEDHLVPAVVPDRPAAGRLAAEHFAERDFEHVAFVARYPWAANEAMYAAFAERAEELGCACHLLQEDIDTLRLQVTSGTSVLALRQESFTRWLRQTPKPLGIFTFGDPVAAVYCQWVVEAKLRVPEDVAVLGLGNKRFICESTAVPLSSVAFDTVAMAEKAFDMLRLLVAGQSLDQTTVMMPPITVVARQSTDVVAASDPHVVKALGFMWDHLGHDLSVAHIAHHAGVSRRTLEKLFKRDLGRGINQEYQRRRLDKACDLLRLTSLPIRDIAGALGYSHLSVFTKAFRAAYGTSPTEYRRQHA